MKLHKIFYSKLLMAALLILLAGVFTLELRQWRQREAVNAEINHLIGQQQAMEQKNLDLQQSLQYFSSDSYKEKLAREQLGLQRKGEIVFNFPQLANPDSENSSHAPELSNPEKWWQYIFLQNFN